MNFCGVRNETLIFTKTSTNHATTRMVTLTLYGSGFHSVKNAWASDQVEAIVCFTARTPALRMVSPMTYLFLLAGERSMGLDLVVPLEWMVERESARVTPVSAPGKIATTHQGSAASCEEHSGTRS